MYIKSPLNYIGGKYKILKDIFPIFPDEINTFVDLFAGGMNISINCCANKIIVNDQITYLIQLYEYIKKEKLEGLLLKIDKIISKYNLSLTNAYGYNKLREDYNNNPNELMLFVLTCYSFNHQIRFNNSHKFNTPFGKNRSSYNDNIKDNLIKFSNKLKESNYQFYNLDFRKFDFSNFNNNDFVYCDPPYLITTGSYNDGNRGFKDWSDKDDIDLLNLLDELNTRNVRFALSNVLIHKGLKNERLIEWSKKYNIKYIDKSYSNCNYHLKDKEKETIEVLIYN